MKRTIFGQTWAIVIAVLATVIGGLIVNSFTKWWTVLANITNAAWVATSEATVGTFTYKVPIWAVVTTVALVLLTRYVAQRTGRTLKDSTPTDSTPNFLNYHEDIFDGVLCRWEYKQPFRGAPFRIENLLCYCQHCDFIIGTPNNHEQKCPSCSRRTVKGDNTPFYVNNFPGYGIAGYIQRENNMPFEGFIRLEIDRRIRRGEWFSPGKTEIT